MGKLTQAAVAVALVAATFAAPAKAEGDAAKGKTLFSRCSACHAVTDQNKVGPSLLGIVGRTAGTLPGARYSKAMTASGITWNDETLGTFLAAPAKTVPGTTMAVGLPNAQDRDDIIAYLNTLKP
jgi:cytochrome c